MADRIAAGQRADDGGHGTGPGHGAFLALRFVGGGASAIVLVLASALVLERLAETRRTGLSALHFAGVGSGIAVSAVLVAAMLAPARAGNPSGSPAAWCR